MVYVGGGCNPGPSDAMLSPVCPLRHHQRGLGAGGCSLRTGPGGTTVAKDEGVWLRTSGCKLVLSRG